MLFRVHCWFYCFGARSETPRLKDFLRVILIWLNFNIFSLYLLRQSLFSQIFNWGFCIQRFYKVCIYLALIAVITSNLIEFKVAAPVWLILAYSWFLSVFIAKFFCRPNFAPILLNFYGHLSFKNFSLHTTKPFCHHTTTLF